MIHHNIERHIEKRKNNALAGAVLGGILDGILQAYTGTHGNAGNAWAHAGALAYSKDFEREADYLSMYILAKTGNIKLDLLYQFWEKVSRTRKDRGSFNVTHPSDAERSVALKMIAKEIEHKRSSGERLFPNRR